MLSDLNKCYAGSRSGQACKNVRSTAAGVLADYMYLLEQFTISNKRREKVAKWDKETERNGRSFGRFTKLPKTLPFIVFAETEEMVCCWKGDCDCSTEVVNLPKVKIGKLNKLAFIVTMSHYRFGRQLCN